MNLPTIRAALAEATENLRCKGIQTARLDAEVLLAFVLETTRTDLFINGLRTISESRYTQYMDLVARRGACEPVAYITGEKEFMSLPFRVNRNVLVPRPETEMLVEEALAIKPLSIIDVGTGSGAIAVSLAYYLPDSQVTAIDISPAALEIARENAEINGVSDRIVFIEGNLLDPVYHTDNFGQFDLVAANLPYIPSPEMDNLPVDVSAYEPERALDGGKAGLVYYRELCPAAFGLLRNGGTIIMEIGYDQAAELSSFLLKHGYSDVSVLKDLAGFDRMVKARKAE